MKSFRTSAVRGTALAVAAFVLISTYGRAQERRANAPPRPPTLAGAVRDLQDQVRQLRSHGGRDARRKRGVPRRNAPAAPGPANHARVTGTAGGASAAAGLRRLPPLGRWMTPAAASRRLRLDQLTPAPLEERVQKLEESTSLIGSKIDEQYQTKVESASKYRARLHGIVLMNAFRNVGGSDNLDFPDYSEPVPRARPLRPLGATLRQSEIGFEIFGPNLVGAQDIGRCSTGFRRRIPRNRQRRQTSESSGCRPPASASTGNILRWSRGRMLCSSRHCRPHRSRRWPRPHLPLPETFGPGPRNCGSNTASPFPTSKRITVQAGILDNLDWEYPRIRSTGAAGRRTVRASRLTRSARRGRVRFGSIPSASA